jgi:hypothetical protein
VVAAKMGDITNKVIDVYTEISLRNAEENLT